MPKVNNQLRKKNFKNFEKKNFFENLSINRLLSSETKLLLA